MFLLEKGSAKRIRIAIILMKESAVLLKTISPAKCFSIMCSKFSLVSVLLGLCVVSAANAQVLVYDNLSTAPTAGFGDFNANNPIFGDSLNLTQGGRLSVLGLTLFNPNNSDNPGSILTGSMVVKFYDNTVPYTGGALNNPLLGTAIVPWDFTGIGGLHPGFFAPNYVDLTSLNITLPQHILITQQFTETSGTSIRNGMALMSNPTTGTSPNNVFLSSAAISPALYNINGGVNPGQVGYQIQVVPEPGAFALTGLAASALLIVRRRK
jgi:hypothetical protein